MFIALEYLGLCACSRFAKVGESWVGGSLDFIWELERRRRETQGLQFVNEDPRAPHGKPSTFVLTRLPSRRSSLVTSMFGASVGWKFSNPRHNTRAPRGRQARWRARPTRVKGRPKLRPSKARGPGRQRADTPWPRSCRQLKSQQAPTPQPTQQQQHQKGQSKGTQHSDRPKRVPDVWSSKHTRRSRIFGPILANGTLCLVVARTQTAPASTFMHSAVREATDGWTGISASESAAQRGRTAKRQRMTAVTVLFPTRRGQTAPQPRVLFLPATRLPTGPSTFPRRPGTARKSLAVFTKRSSVSEGAQGTSFVECSFASD